MLHIFVITPHYTQADTYDVARCAVTAERLHDHELISVGWIEHPPVMQQHADHVFYDDIYFNHE